MTIETHGFASPASPFKEVTLTPEPPASNEEALFSVDFRAIVFLIRRNLILICGVIALALAIGFIVTMLTTPRYVATAQLQIDQEADRVLEDRSAVQPEVAIQDADRFLNTQLDVIKSRTMALRVAQTLGLVGNKAFFTSMREQLPEPSPRVAPARALEEATLKIISDNLSVALPRESRVASISFESPDPQLAARVANTYAREYIASNLQRKFNSSAYARDFLSGQLATAKERLEGSERDLNDYARNAGLIRTSDPGTDAQGLTRPSQSVTAASLVQLNEAALTARADRIAAEGKWRTIASTSAFDIPEVLANPAIQQLTQQRAVAQATLQQERVRHLDDYPSVVQARAQVDVINSQLTTLANQIKQSVYATYKAAVARENELNQQVAGYKTAVQGEQQRGVRFGILSRETDTNRTLYEGLLQRYKEVSAAAGISTNNVSIVDEAAEPLRPSSPRLMVNLALSLLIGMAAAAALVMIREQLDDVIRVPDDIENKLGLPVLGSIPVNEDADRDITSKLDETKSDISEAYNALRTSLLYSTPRGLPQVVTITSSEAGEGKTTTSYALARALARIGKRIVLISADLRRPAMHKLFDLPNERGLTDALVSDMPAMSVVNSETGIENLSIISSGPIPPNPTELLGSPRLRDVVAELKGHFDVVLIDGPPVLGLADAPLISAIAEATVFVIESDRGARGSTKAAMRRLRAAHAVIVGAVLTKLNSSKVGQYYGYTDYQYYAYGEDSDTPRPRRFFGL